MPKQQPESAQDTESKQQPSKQPHTWKHIIMIIVSFIAGVGVFAAVYFLLVTPANLVDEADTVLEQETEEQEIVEDDMREDVGEEDGQDVVELEDEIDLGVDWRSKYEVTAESIGLALPEDRDFGYLEPGEVHVYNVGRVEEPSAYEGYDFFVIRARFGFSRTLLRVIQHRDRDGKPILLTNLSHDISYDEEFFESFSLSDDFDVPELHLPDELELSKNGQTFTLVEEPFSPDELFSEFLVRDVYNPTTGQSGPRPVSTTFSNDEYGSIFEDLISGYFLVKVPDGSTKLYRLAFPFGLEEDQPGPQGILIASSEVDWSMPDETVREGAFTPVRMIVCPPRAYDLVHNVDGRVEPAGAINGETVYVPSEATEGDDGLYDEVYDQVYVGGGLTFNEFVDEDPLFLWQDDLGRWFRWRDVEYFPAAETECPWRNSVL